jgi:hypothetical protein
MQGRGYSVDLVRNSGNTLLTRVYHEICIELVVLNQSIIFFADSVCASAPFLISD